MVTVCEADGRLVAVVWTWRSGTIRVISMRRARVKKDGGIASYTAEELRAMIARGESRTDSARVDAVRRRHRTPATFLTRRRSALNDGQPARHCRGRPASVLRVLGLELIELAWSRVSRRAAAPADGRWRISWAVPS